MEPACEDGIPFVVVWSLCMSYSPSIVPEADHGTYFVLNDFGDGLGRAWPEADEERTEREY